MMFLQYAIWGAWLPLMYTFLSTHREFEGGEIGYMFMAGGVGAIFGPFIAGQIADRYFNTEKFLGISHILGGCLVFTLAYLTHFWSFLAFSLAYSLIYTPTLALTNSLAFHHINDRDRDFGLVRVWGTIGWICVGIGIGQWLLYQYTDPDAAKAVNDATQAAGIADAFKLSGILGILMGLYCFTLPKTPPAKDETNNAALEAIGETRRQPLLTLFFLAIPISCIHQFYFVHTAPFLGNFQNEVATDINNIFGVGGGGLMTIGQMSEVLVLAVIPFFAKRFSRKSLLLIGVLAYAARMALFAYVDPIADTTGIAPVAILIAGVALHGLCFGCFIFVAFMVVDEETQPDIRASAQNLFNVIIFGVGIIAGSLVAGYVGEWATEAVIDAAGTPVLDATTGEPTTAMNFTKLFSIPLWASLACLLILLIMYPGGKRKSIGGDREVVEP